ncbi:MAG TPA: carbohydrate kinase [Chloroflexi bacterium]|nr:carbohydrate kinase [Chloroflexota bacterium]
MVDVICLGEALIDIFAPVGMSLKEAEIFRRAPGGAPANVAAALAKLCVSVGFIGKVGEDPFGHLLAETLAGVGVDISLMRFEPEARTTLAWVAQPDVNRSEFIFYRHPGADMLLRADEIDADYVTQARIFHYGSISLIADPSRTATFYALEVAKEAGALISYDPNWRPFLWRGLDHARQGILEGLTYADLVKVNETELEFMTGHADIDAGSQWLLERDVRLVVVTRGPEGSYFNDGRAKGFVTAFRVDTVDATGCGDGFVAGLLASLLERGYDLEGLTGPDLRAILQFANAVGALTATRKGVIPALPTREAVRAFLAANTPGADRQPGGGRGAHHRE